MGYGSEFVGFLGSSHCSHCGNTAKAALYAKYSSETFLFVTEYTYDGVSVVCPICHHGWEHTFTAFSSRLARLFMGKKAKAKRAAAINILAEIESQLDIQSLRHQYASLGWLQKRSYRKMLYQLRFQSTLVNLLHGIHAPHPN